MRSRLLLRATGKRLMVHEVALIQILDQLLLLRKAGRLLLLVHAMVSW